MLQPGNGTGLAGIPVHKCIQKMAFNIKVMGNINVFVSIECEDCVCININLPFHRKQACVYFIKCWLEKRSRHLGFCCVTRNGVHVPFFFFFLLYTCMKLQYRYSIAVITVG